MCIMDVDAPVQLASLNTNEIIKELESYTGDAGLQRKLKEANDLVRHYRETLSKIDERTQNKETKLYLKDHVCVHMNVFSACSTLYV